MGTRTRRGARGAAVVAAAGGMLAALAVGAPAATAAAGPTTAPAAGAATAGQSGGGAGRALSPETRFFSPPAPAAAIQQERQLEKKGDPKAADLIAHMVSTPQAVWFTGSTPSRVQDSVAKTMAEAAGQRAVPVLVAYNIPGRDCAQYSAGGARNQAAYDKWVAAFARGLGQHRAVVLLEPDSLANLPSDCASYGSPSYPFTDAERYAEIQYAVSVLEKDGRARVYLDAGQSAWQSVGTMTATLIQADVSAAQGFFLNVSNYQPTVEENTYGAWVSDCIDLVTDNVSGNWMYGHPDYCESQYYPAQQDNNEPWQTNYATWGQVTQWYQSTMSSTGVGPATVPFVVDTSRNGRGPNDMQGYGTAPYNQPASVVSTLVGGNWCNSPAAGLGLAPTASTGQPLVDAYLWVKTPGQSDGQCDAAGGVRAWDYQDFRRPGWPTTASAQNLFDPLWGTYDPAAGAWFDAQALQLARLADESPQAPQNQ
jgi:endoglucanase